MKDINIDSDSFKEAAKSIVEEASIFKALGANQDQVRLKIAESLFIYCVIATKKIAEKRELSEDEYTKTLIVAMSAFQQDFKEIKELDWMYDYLIGIDEGREEYQELKRKAEKEKSCIQEEFVSVLNALDIFQQ